jgi:hypothetical protein
MLAGAAADPSICVLLQDGLTPLYYAASLRHLDAMWQLVKAGAAVDAVSQVRVPPVESIASN